MDETDVKILELLERDGRMSWQDLGNAIGLSRAGAKKRVQKLEREGVIRGYRAVVRREKEVTMLIDIVALPGRLEAVLAYVSENVPHVRQMFLTTMENHVHMEAVSESVADLRKLTRQIRSACGGDIAELQCHAVKEVLRDIDGGIRDERTGTDSDGNHEPDRGSGT